MTVEEYSKTCIKCNKELVVGEDPKGYPITPMPAMNGFSATPYMTLEDWRKECGNFCYGCYLRHIYSADIAEEKEIYDEYIEEHDRDAQEFLDRERD